MLEQKSKKTIEESVELCQENFGQNPNAEAVIQENAEENVLIEEEILMESTDEIVWPEDEYELEQLLFGKKYSSNSEESESAETAPEESHSEKTQFAKHKKERKDVKKCITTMLEQITDNHKKITADIIFAICIAFVIPILFPMILNGYAIILQNDFAKSISQDAKCWVLITQTVGVFVGLRNTKKVAYLTMLIMILGMYLIECLIFALGLLPIW